MIYKTCNVIAWHWDSSCMWTKLSVGNNLWPITIFKFRGVSRFRAACAVKWRSCGQRLRPFGIHKWHSSGQSPRPFGVHKWHACGQSLRLFGVHKWHACMQSLRPFGVHKWHSSGQSLRPLGVQKWHSSGQSLRPFGVHKWHACGQSLRPFGVHKWHSSGQSLRPFGVHKWHACGMSKLSYHNNLRSIAVELDDTNKRMNSSLGKFLIVLHVSSSSKIRYAVIWQILKYTIYIFKWNKTFKKLRK